MQLPEIALCPVLWRLSILEKRHCPLTTQAIKKPPPPFIIISAHTLHCQSLSAPACQAEQLCRTQPAVHRYHLSHFTSRNFPDPLERLQESPISYYWSHPDDKNNNNKKKSIPQPQKKLAQSSQWLRRLTAVNGNEWSHSKSWGPSGCIIRLSFSEIQKRTGDLHLRVCLPNSCKNLKHLSSYRQTDNAILPFTLQGMYSWKWSFLLPSLALWPGSTNTGLHLLTPSSTV